MRLNSWLAVGVLVGLVSVLAACGSHRVENGYTIGRYANLYDADLHNADLRNADLREASLVDADLRKADLRNADLRETRLYDADLRKADLRNADLTSAKLSGADMRGADLYGANLTLADLVYADLRGADMRGVNLSGTNVTLTKLALPLLGSGGGVMRGGIRLSNTDLIRAGWYKADLSGIIWDSTTRWPSGFAPPPSR